MDAFTKYAASKFKQAVNTAQDAEDDPRTGYDYWELHRNKDK